MSCVVLKMKDNDIYFCELMFTNVIFLILILKTRLQSIAGKYNIGGKTVTLLLLRGSARLNP